MIGACFLLFPTVGHALTDIVNTKHNFSVSGPGPIKALTESRICVFCHTPHNATPGTPLWNKDIQPQTYTVYTSPTLKAGNPDPIPQPFGPTKLCLSCHDGTIAIGAVVNPSGGITMMGGTTIPVGSPSYFGVDLSSHHPVSFLYSKSLPNDELVSPPPSTLVFGGADPELHCTTCHDPHNDTYGDFLAMDNRYSALCTSCHQMTNWSLSGHAAIEQGCEVCHAPHFALDSPLLNYTSSDYCLSCHNPAPSDPPLHGESVAAKAGVTAIKSPPLSLGSRADIKAQTKKLSGHHEQPGFTNTSLRSLKGASRSMVRSATCVDCHNPHAANKQKASAPYASGMLKGVSGVDRNGMEVSAATYEYEVCFKCHSDYSTNSQYIPRVINTTNLRMAFEPENPSYHPVVSMGKNISIPSIPSPLEPGLNALDTIYCTDCHRDDAGGSKGPHGSSFAPILRERYETADNTPESYQNYSLCYRCHNQASILSDASFRNKRMRTTATGGGHSGHLANGAPCSACHDPHGVNMSSSIAMPEIGSHTHLINFDTSIVMPTQGNRYPFFTDKGTFSGSCTLVCHGKIHNDLSY